jgi:hypothetical protein
MVSPDIEKMRQDRDVEGLLRVIRAPGHRGREIATRKVAVDVLCSLGEQARYPVAILLADDSLDAEIRARLESDIASLPVAIG